MHRTDPMAAPNSPKLLGSRHRRALHRGLLWASVLVGGTTWAGKCEVRLRDSFVDGSRLLVSQLLDPCILLEPAPSICEQ